MLTVSERPQLLIIYTQLPVLNLLEEEGDLSAGKHLCDLQLGES